MYNRMGKIYTISIGSGARIDTTTTLMRADYNVNWDEILPNDKSFYVSFSFISSTVNITSLTVIPVIAVSLGSTNTHRIAFPAHTSTPASNTVGILTPHTLSTTTFLRGESSSNYRSFLKSRPVNNVMNVLIFNPTGNVAWTDNVGGVPVSYVLILSLEEVDE